VLRHRATNGREFVTVYQHLAPGSTTHLAVGESVTRGQLLGRVPDNENGDGYSHLHFMVGVRGPAATVNGTRIPAHWYAIDPFGVYDYRRNLNSQTSYNYLPNNRLDVPTRGVHKAYVWRTDPPIGSIQLPPDCLSVRASSLRITQSGRTFRITDGRRSLFSFPNRTEANQALNILRNYNISQSCFIGRPDPSLQYLLAGGTSPSGRVSREDCIAFNANSLRIVPSGSGRYRIESSGSKMFDFPNMLEAGNAYSVIKKYNFNRSCFVGRPQPSMKYLRR
jgi:hypothetical protein